MSHARECAKLLADYSALSVNNLTMPNIFSSMVMYVEPTVSSHEVLTWVARLSVK